MKFRARICVFATVLALLTTLAGCGTVGAQVQAITDAVVSYSDYYIEVRNLTDQVRSQAAQTVDGQRTADYTITVDIPDYVHMDRSAAGFVLPAPDFTKQTATSYQKQASLLLRQSLEQYSLEHTASAYVHLPVTFSVVSNGNSWTANLSSRSKLDIQQTVEDMISAVLSGDEPYRNNYRRLQVTSALPGLLTGAFGGEAYARLLTVTDLTRQPDGSYAVSFSFPDPEFVYAALANRYTASFNQPFYGDERAAVLTTDDISEIDLSQSPLLSASVSVSLDENTGGCTLLYDGGLGAGIAEVRSRAETSASAAVNAAWRVAPQAAPDSGAVLEGVSEGNSIVFKTSESLGKYFYVRFYAISGEDVSEEGTLALGVFIRGGKSANLHLPSGYYRVSCTVGNSWYGLEDLFGADGTVYEGGNAVRSRSGYVNTVSFE
ncbi:MAG: hypothetical protein GX417_11510 [Clostridiales bacterium]|nr:hypothetical protein [Clostridiales bacterium]